MGNDLSVLRRVFSQKKTFYRCRLVAQIILVNSRWGKGKLLVGPQIMLP